VLSIGTNIGYLERKIALILRYFPNLVVSGAHCVKVVDKGISRPMDNLR